MSFLDVMRADETARNAGPLITKLRSDGLPSNIRDKAQTIATKIDGIDATLNSFRSDLVHHPNYFQDDRYAFEYAQQLQAEANRKIIADKDPPASSTVPSGAVTSC